MHDHALPHPKPSACLVLSQNIPLLYHLNTLWLLTKSDVKTVILPQMTFALASSLSNGFTSSEVSVNPLNMTVRLLQSLLWLWLTLLVADISNQRLPDSIMEDSINKPWRVFPSQRISPEQACHFMLFLVPGVVALSMFLGAYRETLTLFCLLWMYNDLGGANESLIWRNILNSAGLTCFSAGTIAITAGTIDYDISSRPVCWLLVCACAISTTIHAQDLPDVEGDAARGRVTIPLLLGDRLSRISLVFGVVFWSFICPWFWHLSLLGFVPTVLAGCVFVFQTLYYRDVKSDKLVWKLWCIWAMTIYLIPVFHVLGHGKHIA